MRPMLDCFAYNLDFLREQVANLSPQQMVSQPKGIANHPAWIVGHLTYSCQAIGGEIGLQQWLSAEWARLFGAGSVPVSDVDEYPDKVELLNALRDGQNIICDAVELLNAEQLAAQLPDHRYRHLMPTIENALIQVLAAHSAYHIGQLTLWRHAMGLPNLNRPFM